MHRHGSYTWCPVSGPCSAHFGRLCSSAFPSAGCESRRAGSGRTTFPNLTHGWASGRTGRNYSICRMKSGRLAGQITPPAPASPRRPSGPGGKQISVSGVSYYTLLLPYGFRAHFFLLSYGVTSSATAGIAGPASRDSSAVLPGCTLPANSTATNRNEAAATAPAAGF